MKNKLPNPQSLGPDDVDHPTCAPSTTIDDEGYDPGFEFVVEIGRVNDVTRTPLAYKEIWLVDARYVKPI
jgi:hypothetical protein